MRQVDLQKNDKLEKRDDISNLILPIIRGKDDDANIVEAPSKIPKVLELLPSPTLTIEPTLPPPPPPLPVRVVRTLNPHGSSLTFETAERLFRADLVHRPFRQGCPEGHRKGANLQAHGTVTKVHRRESLYRSWYPRQPRLLESTLRKTFYLLCPRLPTTWQAVQTGAPFLEASKRKSMALGELLSNP